ncbi:MAG: hypothetical protein GY865_12550 [candidate division Zixibacteria bacterium]|nr:hypothetical protein [candidate division Zixibacteria bacterium]
MKISNIEVKRMKTMVIVFSVLMILVISCSLFQKSGDQLFNNGLELLETGDYYGAIETFDKIDSLYPDSPYGYFGRAIAFEKDRRYIDALNAYLRIQVIDKDFVPGLKALISLASRTGRPDLALGIASQYRELEDDSLTLIALNAELLLNIGEYKLARDEIVKITSGVPSNPIQHLFYAKLLLHEGDFETALDHCSQALELDGGNIEILLEIASIYASISHYDLAAKYLKTALDVESIDYYQKADIAEVFLDMNYLADVYQIVDELEQASFQNNIVSYLKTKLLLANKQAIWAKQYYSKAIARNKMTPAQQIYMADVKFESRDIQGAKMAIEHADQIAEAESFHIGLRNELTLKKPELFLKIWDWRSAEGIFVPLEGMLPMDFETIFLKAWMNLMANRKDAAFESISRLEILVKDNSPRLAKFGKLYLNVDSLETAEKYFDQALINDKINIDAIFGKVNILKREKKYAAAIDFLNKQNQLILSNPILYPELVSIYKESGELKKARDFAYTLIKNAPGDIDKYILAIELAREDGSLEDVGSIVKTCLENNPDNGYAMLLSGEYYTEISSFDKAETQFQSAVSTGIMTYDAYYRLGLLLEKKGEIDSSFTYFKKSAAINQFFGKPYSRMAAIMINQENIDKKSLATLMNYVNLAHWGGINPDDFITKGRGQVIQTKYSQAKISFDKALEADPNNPVYNYYVGMNYIKLDSPKKAKTYLNKAIKNGLSGELKSNAENLLSGL